MRVVLLSLLSLIVLIGTASLALHIEASISKDEYIKPEAPLATLETEFEEGILSYTGALKTPTACAMVVAAPAVEGNTVRIDVTVTEDKELCLMRPTIKEFTGEIEAEEKVTASLFINGAKALIVDTL